MGDNKDDTHYRILKLLEDKPNATQRDLAEAIGISLGKVNYCVRALVEKGFIKIRRFGESRNKVGYIYVLTPSGLTQRAVLGGSFLKRKMKEYEALKSEIEGLMRSANAPVRDHYEK